MHRRTMQHATAALLPLGAITACNRAAPVQQGGGEFLGRGTLTQRAEQIRRAGSGLGRVMQADGPGCMRGVLNNARTRRSRKSRSTSTLHHPPRRQHEPELRRHADPSQLQ